MAQDQLALFPLGVVLFPEALLPLHIFEDRYKEMIADVMGVEGEFGVVLANEKGMAGIGCTATIERILKKYPDGRMDILARGRRRFEIIMVDEERSYLQASVAMIADEGEEDAGDLLRQRVLSAWTNLMVLEHGGILGDPPDANRGDFSFVVADVVPDLDFRQGLLNMRSEKQRLEALASFLPNYVEREKLTRHVRRVAPLNGYSKHTPEARE